MSENKYYEEIIIKPCFVKLVRLTIVEDGEQEDTIKIKRRRVRKKISSRNKEYLSRGPVPERTRIHIARNHKALCVFCENSYKNLGQHLLTHIQERPYFCRYCEKSFTDKSNWAAHETAHTGQRPNYVCLECNVGFSRTKNLYRHQRVIHQNYRIHCPLCSGSLSRKSYLRKHIQMAHNVESGSISEIIKLAKETTKSNIEGTSRTITQLEPKV